MTGREAYEEDVRRCPNYGASGGPRRQWHQLEDYIQASWNRKPTPREYSRKERTL